MGLSQSESFVWRESLVAWLGSASVFIGVAVASQWIRYRKDQGDESPRLCAACQQLPRGSTGQPARKKGSSEEMTARQLYKQRRLHDRLSFHSFQEGESQSFLPARSPAARMSSRDHVEKHGCVEHEQNDHHYDAFPPSNEAHIEETEGEQWESLQKSSNWNHFEMQQEHRQATLDVIPYDGNSLEGDEGPGELANGLNILQHYDSCYSGSSHQNCVDISASYQIDGAPTITSPDMSRPSALSRAVSLDDRTLWDDGRSSGLSSRSLARSISDPDPPYELLQHSMASAQSIDHYETSLPNLVCRQNRIARAHYNARIMPDRVFLVRHGQSMGNIDETLYSTTPDNAMPLTRLGWDQAREAGKLLRQQLLAQSSGHSDGTIHASMSTPPIHFIVSPYVRTVETFHGMASAWCDPAQFQHITNREDRLKAWYARLLELGLTWHEDPRIREQDFGNYQDPEQIRRAKLERIRFGAFYYRFPHGESASDVYDRISTFLDSLWRSFDINTSRNYCIITHGIAIRVLMARYFRYTIDQFNLMANPRNASVVILQHDGEGRLHLHGRYELELEQDVLQKVRSDEDDGSERKHNVRVNGYVFHKRMRVLPPEHIHQVKIRMSYGE